jgi:hypothetical protein
MHTNYLNTVAFFEVGIMLLLLVILLFTLMGILNGPSQPNDVLLRLNGSLDYNTFPETFTVTMLPRAIAYDLTAHGGCMVSQLTLLGPVQACARFTCSGFLTPTLQLILQATDKTCRFQGYIRLLGAGSIFAKENIT